MKSTFFFLVTLALLNVEPAAADQPVNAAAKRSVIQTQLDAFRRDDAQTAYAQASPEIRSIFPSTAIFMSMVWSGYSALITPIEVDFLDVVEANGRPVYRVLVEGRDGRRWMALYTMSRQADGSWLIGGCVLVKLAEEAA